jgi:radical SAM protein (TIGR01212 family)
MTQRYLSFNSEIKKVFGARVDRITLNAGLTCPNIDGFKAKGGCAFCQDASYWGLTIKNDSQPASIRDQIFKGMDYLKTRYPSKNFFAYFQNGTNTYAPVETLRKFYEEALSVPEIVGLFISTRPDCVGNEVCDLLEELHQKTYLWVELGMPSHRQDQNKRLNRAHTVEDFNSAVERLSTRGIRTCAHVILGLPGEKPEEMAERAQFFNQSAICGIKIHNLVVFNETVLARWYRDQQYVPLTLEDYSQRCVDFLENLRPDILIHRLIAHGPRHVTVAPEWSINKMATLNAVHAELERRDTWQGKKLATRGIASSS